MVTKVKAIYENGYLRPLEPVDWPEHSEFEVSLVPVAPDRLKQLLLNGQKLAGRVDAEAEAERARLNALIRAEMYRDDPEVGTPDEELAKLIGFDPNDAEKMRELVEEQRQAILSAFPLVNGPDAIPRIGFDVDEDDIIYS